jgi:hypothetical protein
MPDPRYVYLVAAPDGLHKIGQTYSPIRRLGWLGPKSAGLRLAKAVLVLDATWLERYLHHAFAHRWIRGEWFKLEPSDIALVHSIADLPVEGLLPASLRSLHAGSMGRPKKSEPTEPMRLPASVVKRIKRIAAHRDKDPGDYVAERFGPQLDADEAEMLDDIKREKGAADAKKPKK